jgi:arsenate reductase
MAEAILRRYAPWIEVASAGTFPAERVHPFALAVMREINLDLAGAVPKSVDRFLASSFDDVITVCDNARESCPVFTGRVTTRLHMGFDDPALAVGTDEEILGEFRRVRDEIRTAFRDYAEGLPRPQDNPTHLSR